MKEFTIEKTIPLPDYKTEEHERKTLLLKLQEVADKMEVGDSILTNFQEALIFGDIITVQRKYKAKKLEDGNYRIWRVE